MSNIKFLVSSQPVAAHFVASAVSAVLHPHGKAGLQALVVVSTSPEAHNSHDLSAFNPCLAIHSVQTVAEVPVLHHLPNTLHSLEEPSGK